jgi:hypothetical protein
MGAADKGLPKPKMSGPKPFNASAAQGANPQPFWAGWGANLNQQSKQIGDGANKWWIDVTKNSKGWKAPKWEMPGKIVLAHLYELTVSKYGHIHQWW